MNKYLFNNTDHIIYIESLDLTLEPYNEFEVPYEMIHIYVDNAELLHHITNERVQVGVEGSLIMDPFEGEAFFRTMDGEQAFVSDSNAGTVEQFNNLSVTDPPTGKKAAAFFMNMLTMMRELYNSESNPVYLEDFVPILGEAGWAEDHVSRIWNLEDIHAKLGWHTQEIYSYGKGRPLDLLVYYGYMNSFNSLVNQWNNEKVAQDMSKYGLIVLGDGVAYPDHPDYKSAVIIVNRIKELNPLVKIFGYISVNLQMEEWNDIVNTWADLGVHGMFLDEAGYDFGVPETHSRSVFNEKVDIIHAQPFTNLCFVNAWNMDHIIGTVNDPKYPNQTWNPKHEESHLTHNDWYLLESFAVNTLAYNATNGYASGVDWATRGVKAQGHRNTYGINLASLGVIDDEDPKGQELFNFSYISALEWSLESNGTSSNYYGSSTAQVAHWERESLIDLGRIWNLNASVQLCEIIKEMYIRYVDHGKFEICFEAKNQYSRILKY